MLFVGVALLGVGIIAWGLSRFVDLPEIVVVILQAAGAIGFILLAIGLILHFAPLGDTVDEETLKGLIR